MTHGDAIAIAGELAMMAVGLVLLAKVIKDKK